ncbi:unnamed protein product [Allacma fusca]|uniref:NADH dehydrogenase [ubiquinone] 1 beta subcomplex subunit 10 n=1 Tax=Allacma fusca TaxID=39272 RepID=A0A8J2KV85_9HEXA|nr:unnamed protein product [Allacma fusca]
MSDDCQPPPAKQFSQPIYGRSKLEDFNDRVGAFFRRPVVWFRETIVVPNRKEYAWYHQKFPRVKDIDQCYMDEIDCIYEANEQFKRDKLVDNMILNLLRYRMDDCVREEYPDHAPRCFQLKEDYETAAGNWFSRYGELGGHYHVKEAYMRQKHRMLWERRHGPIGCGMKSDPYSVEPESH